MKKLLFFLLLAATVVGTAAGAEIYRWTDQEGTVHFSDSLDSVPAASRKSVQPFTLEHATKAGTKATGRTTAPAVEPALPDADTGAAPQLDELKERMVHDQGIMKLIRALQSDPKLQSLLSDPALLEAASSGDFEALINNPVIKKLLQDPRVREIEQRVQKGGAR